MTSATLALEGAVNLQTVPEFVARIPGQLSSGIAVVDFSRVTEVDSSAVALALEWRRAARSFGKTVTIANIPDAMRHLANLYGVMGLIEAESV